MTRAYRRYSNRSRARRARLFLELLKPTADDLVLDLGSEDGTHIARILTFRDNVYIADINAEALERGRERYGFQSVLIGEDGRVPFPDGHFDIVFCSSVIEHVTVDKDAVLSSRDFAAAAFERQRRFAEEIRRVSKRFFVQTPNKWFLVESHTWLPGLIVLLPRRMQIALILRLGRSGWWPKRTAPDWHLLTPGQVARLFPDAEIIRERSLGFTKSLIAVRR